MHIFTNFTVKKNSQSFVAFLIIFMKFYVIRRCLDASDIIYTNVHI